jgi:hypothetical protein
MSAPRKPPPPQPRIVWFPEMIAAYHAGKAAGWAQTRIAARIGVSVPAMLNAVRRGDLG